MSHIIPKAKHRRYCLEVDNFNFIQATNGKKAFVSLQRFSYLYAAQTAQASDIKCQAIKDQLDL